MTFRLLFQTFLAPGQNLVRAKGNVVFGLMGKIANRQSLVFSERGQLSQAIPQFHVERMLNERTPIARFESQHNERRACED